MANTPVAVIAALHAVAAAGDMLPAEMLTTILGKVDDRLLGAAYVSAIETKSDRLKRMILARTEPKHDMFLLEVIRRFKVRDVTELRPLINRASPGGRGHVLAICIELQLDDVVRELRTQTVNFAAAAHTAARWHCPKVLDKILRLLEITMDASLKRKVVSAAWMSLIVRFDSDTEKMEEFAAAAGLPAFPSVDVMDTLWTVDGYDVVKRRKICMYVVRRDQAKLAELEHETRKRQRSDETTETAIKREKI